MLRPLTLSLVAYCWCTAALMAAEDAPRMAVVRAVEAEVRSGPGEQFYATDRLVNGSRVEVYRTTEAGWCAIRPPAGSFSYVRASHVQPTQRPNLLQVRSEGTKSRVGSKLTRSMNVEYISLHAGEALQAIGGPIGTGTNRWYRIAPPAGEFRWMRLRDLQLVGDPIELSTAPARPATPARTVGNRRAPRRAMAADVAVPAPETTIAADQPLPPEPGIALADQEQVDEPLDDDGMVSIMVRPEPPAPRPRTAAPRTRATSSPAPAPASSDQAASEPTARPDRLPRGMQTMPIPKSAPPTVEPIQTAAYASDARDDSGQRDALQPIPQADWQTSDHDFAAGDAESLAEPTSTLAVRAEDELQLAELELALSEVVTGEIGSWDLGPIQAATSQLARQTQIPETAAAARLLHHRAAEFAALQQRHQELIAAETSGAVSLASAVMAVDSDPALVPALARTAPAPPATRRSAPRDASSNPLEKLSDYAGSGWLVPVLSGRDDLPQHAITDSEGRVLAFVASRPGLNLRRYERQEVGIVGEPLPGENTGLPTLVAERIVRLDRHR